MNLAERQRRIVAAITELPVDVRETPATEDELARFERAFGDIPAEYRWFYQPAAGTFHRTRRRASRGNQSRRRSWHWVQYSHYSLLATVEAIFNLGTLGRNDTSATPMSDLFRGGIP